MLTICRMLGNFQEEVIVSYLQEKGLLRRNCLCDDDESMYLDECRQKNDKIIFRCHKYQLNKSLRSDSFLIRLEISLQQIIVFVMEWLLETPETAATAMANITEVISVQYCRDMYLEILMRTLMCIGGVGKIVEIYEMVLRKRKYIRKCNVPTVWLGSFYIETYTLISIGI